MKLVLTSLTCAALFLSGCANMSETQQGTAKGAGIGAVAGAVLGAATGGSKGAATGAVLGGAVGAGGGYLWSQRMQQQKAAMEQATAGTGVAVSQTADNRLKLDIPSDISFATGRSDVSTTFAPILNQFATSLNQNPVTTVTIIGHTDSTGSDAINNPLSIDRANATRNYLVARGVAGNRVATDGRGSREPIADNNTNEGRAKNRRVEIYVAEPVQAVAR
ncbi:MAG: OmpA family protein [Polaromonas sp.]|uniref:OmpA family protein n=1 Tax=Polaromonas sp. TaxID=1869339 RepID=UPI002487AA13|nr:OmpA family protein [Polaromonas sp.]MDI1268828.1 OmpA family protein [Polaromonas sp.]MDO9113678.1 OmpA family protein [Polaromonas sp.]MDP2452373.1 OmpA family protein [Polaromonas sp.]MDP3247801.1 OmpA family protein [Polaromonas sp.]MDP3754805.1 OmpA family protein [Polaromonas sp.]